MFQHILRQIMLVSIIIVLLTSPIYTQTNSKASEQEEVLQQSEVLEQKKLSLKFKGTSSQKAIAIIISNQTPITVEIREIMSDFVKNDLKVALVPKEYTYDLNTLTIYNSPFAKEVAFVIKINTYNTSLKEQVLNLNVEILRLSDGEIISQDIAGPRSNIQLITVQIRNMLAKLMTQTNYSDPIISIVYDDLFAFPYKNFDNLRRGDEIIIRYTSARKGLIESIGIVHKMSNDMVLVKDINKRVEVGDKIIRGTPHRNRFYFNIGLIVPTLGESVLSAKSDNKIWESSRYWPAGFKIEGEYERFLPYRLVSTTAFGINMDRTVGTYLMTGIGYRLFKNSWEFIPYIRLGVLYNTIGLNNIEGDVGNLQGFSLRFGANIGINIVKRIDFGMFVGLDIGLQYFPFESISVLVDSKKITPEWKNKNGYSKDFSMTELYPYLSLKIGWIF